MKGRRTMRKMLEESSPRVVETVVYRCEVDFPLQYAVPLTDSPVLGLGSEA